MTAKRDNKNTRSGSTTWVHQPDRIRRDPAPQAKRAAGSSRWSRLTRRRAEERLTITVKYRGGAECWYHVEARGSGGAFPGVMALHDVMREINDGNRHWRSEG
jgi:hypothetical protein